MSSLSVFSRASRATVSRLPRVSLATRSYASKKNIDPSHGQASPGVSSNVGNPGSASAEEQGVKRARGTGTASPDTASIQNPVSNPKGAKVGQQTEDTSTQGAFKQDPNKPAQSKRKVVEEQGKKPLDAADK
ncbi:hypothetical protein F5Y17DRAFT_412687 [Xylariaceae sp. FL0594]|nr:hypothetical protein F5Y17DRAFT_412687 [Xylariaceae sp. FL0594]